MLSQDFFDRYCMSVALKQAEMAFEGGEIPVGAVVAHGGKIIGKGHNQVEQLNDPTAHAEMLAITAACNFKGSKWLEDCTLYVTLEPCLMCAGALFWVRIGRVVFAASDAKCGFSHRNTDALHPKTKICGGMCAKESEQLLEQFFKRLRKR